MARERGGRRLNNKRYTFKKVFTLIDMWRDQNLMEIQQMALNSNRPKKTEMIIRAELLPQ